jgi:hypothetical protein
MAAKSKPKELVLPEDPVLALQQIKDFFRRCNFRSTKDKEADEAKIKTREDKAWNGLRLPDDKAYFINKFLEQESERYNISHEDVSELRHVLFIGVITETIDAKDIVFKDGSITSIKYTEYTSKLSKLVRSNTRTSSGE